MNPSHAATSARSHHRDATVLRIALLLLACTALLAGLRLASTPAAPFIVTLDLVTAAPGQGQVFIATPSGYSELRSVSFPLIADGRRHAYKVSFPDVGVPDRVRVDPGATAGSTRFHSIHLASGRSSVAISGAPLARAIRPLHRIRIDSTLTDGVRLQATGADPYFEVDTPQDLRGPARTQRLIGIAIAAAGVIALSLLAWSSRRKVQAWMQRVATAGSIWSLPAALGASLAVLGALGVGIDAWSARGLGYGSLLLLACLCLALIGAATLELLGVGRRQVGAARLFLWIAIGQVALVGYLFLRSVLFAVVPFLPITAAELFGLVLVSGLFLYKLRAGQGLPATRLETGWALIELGTLAAICWVIADRELPRLLMLSSDPDAHAYLARQLELQGGVPWRGESQFGYPAGSAAMTFAWSRLALLDVRDALTALPLLQTFLAALMIGETFAIRMQTLAARWGCLVLALAIVSAGFLLPLYASYSHMEGAGRQIAIATMAIPLVLLATGPRDAATEWRYAPLILASLLALGALNPANLVVPGILVAAYVFHQAMLERRLSPIAWALLASPLALLLDPYYAALATATEAAAVKVPMTASYAAKSLDAIFGDWLSGLGPQLGQFTHELPRLTPAHEKPVFLLHVVAIGALAAGLLRSRRLRWQVVATVAMALVLLGLASTLFAALRDDSRLFLLAPYFQFGLTQHKTLLVTALAVVALRLATARRLHPMALLCMAMAMVALVAFSVRKTQPMVLQPRAAYCGSLGCIEKSDIAVLHEFERLVANGSLTAPGRARPRVLVPNSVHQTDKEHWVFPVAGARATPFHDVLPVAFYYYQGDVDYTTNAYLAHVCRHFDRAWLKQQGIEYLFLPANRGAACVDAMEQLPFTEHVVFQYGNSYLLRIR